MEDVRAAAHREAFALLEAVQGEEHAGAAAAIPAAEAAAAEWPEVQFVLAAARTVYAVIRPVEGEDRHGLVADLLGRAPEPAAQAIALGLRAVVAAGEGDTALLLGCTSGAVALLDEPSLPGMERCLAYVVNAAALNTLRLWELVDELYDRATEDPASADAAGQTEAVGVNRVLVGLEHALALLEHGDDEAALARLETLLTAATAALRLDLRPLWRADVEAAADVARLLRGTPLTGSLDEHRAALTAQADVEVLPLLEAACALVAWRKDGDARPAAALNVEVSSSSGARTFPLWVQATVLAGAAPTAAVAAQQAHADLVSTLLWESRSAVLGSARAQIAVERRRAEHDRLAQVVNTDPLTGLHNRRRFDDWLSRPAHAGRMALLLLDLDGFKAINDRFGHGTGDEVLRRVGMFLRAAVRPGDLAVRQGGDEFALVLQEPSLDDAAVLARAGEVAAAVRGEDWERVAPGLTVGVSVGAALAVVEEGAVVGKALYEAADQALYRAKREGLPPVLARRVTLGTPPAGDG